MLEREDVMVHKSMFCCRPNITHLAYCMVQENMISTHRTHFGRLVNYSRRYHPASDGAAPGRPRVLVLVIMNNAVSVRTADSESARKARHLPDVVFTDGTAGSDFHVTTQRKPFCETSSDSTKKQVPERWWFLSFRVAGSNSVWT
jgi:hypothetical protein